MKQIGPAASWANRDVVGRSNLTVAELLQEQAHALQSLIKQAQRILIRPTKPLSGSSSYGDATFLSQPATAECTSSLKLRGTPVTDSEDLIEHSRRVRESADSAIARTKEACHRTAARIESSRALIGQPCVDSVTD